MTTHSFTGKHILVTGGAGFIGSHLTDSLLKSGAKVTVLDNFDLFYDRKEKENNLASARENATFNFVEGDIRDGSLMSSLLRENQTDTVVHLAAKAGVRPSLEDPSSYVDVNINGTTILLEAVRKAGIRNFVFASSSSVYGDRTSVPLREDDNTDFPISPYGASKKAGEAICHAYHHVYGLSIACLRFFTVYGPRQRPDLAIRKFVRLALSGEEIPVFGDGSSRRDYTHIRDILTGIEGAIRWTDSPDPSYRIFNLGSSNPVRLDELVNEIETALGQSVKRKNLPAQPGDVRQTYADTTRAEEELGFEPAVSFRDGLTEFIAWVKERHSDL